MISLVSSAVGFVTAVILLVLSLKLARNNKFVAAININSTIWCFTFLMYYLGEVLIFKNPYSDLGQLNFIYIVSLIGGCLGVILSGSLRRRVVFLQNNNSNYDALILLSGMAVVVACLYNVYTFSNMNFAAFFADSSKIRVEKFRYSYQGAPLIYSIVEYIGYLYVPAVFMIAIGAKDKSDVHRILILGVIAFMLGWFNFSRTPIVIFISMLVPMALFNNYIFSKFLRIFKPKSVISIIIFVSMANMISLSRDSGSKISYDILKINYGLKIEDNAFNIAALSNYLYIYTSVNNLNDKYNYQDQNGNYGYGLETFGPLVTFVRKLGIDIGGSEQVFEDSGETNAYIFGRKATYNASTGYATFFEDYGKIAGLFIPTIFVALLTILVAFKYNHMSIFIYSVFFGWIINSPFVNYFQTAGKAIVISAVVILYFQMRQNYVR